MLTLLISLFMGNMGVSADEVTPEPEASSKITIGAADYENLFLRVYPNGNSIVYISTDKGKNWTEVEGRKDTDLEGKEYIEMDISWASPSSNVKLSFKGSETEEETECTLPKQISSFTMKFDRINGDFTITNNSGATIFWWRKASDYEWHDVPFDTTSEGYREFLSIVQSLRYKGAKLVFRTGQTLGTDAENMGNRPSKEIKIAIPKYSNAPSMRLNLTRLTLNTKETMEYTNDLSSGNWIKCEKNMELGAVAAAVFAANGTPGSTVTLYYRVAQTAKKAASRIGCITFPAQTAGPTIGEEDTDISCSIDTSAGKLDIKFLTASTTNMIEYCVVTPGNTFELTTAKWKIMKGVKTVTLKEKAVPDGTTIYFRFKGTLENVKKGIEFKLPSEYTTYKVVWKK